VGGEERILEDEELVFATDQGGAEDAFGHSAIFSCGSSAFGARAGNPHFTDGSMLSLRAWIEFARGDLHGVERDSDSKGAVEVACASDAQAQVAAFTIRPRSCRRSFEETSGD
jgi:hypothetical protein